MNTKWFSLWLSFFLISTFVYSQSKKRYALAELTYGISVHFDKSNALYKISEKYSPGLSFRAEGISSEIDFSLVFNDFSSLFYLEKKMFSDNRAASLVIRTAKYYGRIKQQSSNYITEELEEAFGKFLVFRPYQDWSLHEETKTIGDYLCFKATTFYTITNPKGKVFKHSFTAWYTPQLPYKYGPAGFGNLPGLIIELQGSNFTYGVKKIKFFEDGLESKNNEIPTLKKLKFISEVEFEKLAAEDEKRWQKRDN